MYYSIIEAAKENKLNPYQYLKYLLETLPTAKTSELENLLPWSESLPAHCRIPIKESNIKPERLMYYTKKSPLHNALQKLRERFRVKIAP